MQEVIYRLKSICRKSVSDCYRWISVIDNIRTHFIIDCYRLATSITIDDPSRPDIIDSLQSWCFKPSYWLFSETVDFCPQCDYCYGTESCFLSFSLRDSWLRFFDVKEIVIIEIAETLFLFVLSHLHDMAMLNETRELYTATLATVSQSDIINSQLKQRQIKRPQRFCLLLLFMVFCW